MSKAEQTKLSHTNSVKEKYRVRQGDIFNIIKSVRQHKSTSLRGFQLLCPLGHDSEEAFCMQILDRVMQRALHSTAQCQRNTYRVVIDNLNSYILCTQTTFYLVYTPAKQNEPFLRRKAVVDHIIVCSAQRVRLCTRGIMITILSVKLSVLSKKKQTGEDLSRSKVNARQRKRLTQHPSSSGW